jgi:hypothetical protein
MLKPVAVALARLPVAIEIIKRLRRSCTAHIANHSTPLRSEILNLTLGYSAPLEAEVFTSEYPAG